MPALQRLVLSIFAGLTAGFAAFGLDQLMSAATLGDFVPVTLELASLYPAAGAILGLVLGLIAAVLPEPDATHVGFFGRRFAVALAGLYLISVVERVYVATKVFLPNPVALAGGSFAILALAAGGMILARWAEDPLAAAPLTTVAAAGILVVNRNLVDHPLSTAGLLLDVAVVGMTVLLARLIRDRGRTVVVAGLLGLLIVGAILPRVFRDAGPERNGADATTPNLIFLVLDTLRYDVLESVMAETPEGRAFAERFGDVAWFDDAVAAAPWTAPSVGSIHTGLYPQEHGFGAKAAIQDPNRPLRKLSPRVPTLAGRLSNRGYHTEALITNALLNPSSGIQRGFARYEFLGGPKAKLPLLSVAIRLRIIHAGSYQPAAYVRQHLERRLDILQDAAPFFLWLHFMDPHTPLLEHPQLPPDPTGPQRGDERLYRDEVRYLLSELTTIVEQLDAAGLWQDSAVILVADHGEMFPSDNHDNGVRRRKTGQNKVQGHGHALYQELVRVPLAIRPPGGLSPPRRLDVMASHVDLHDTIIDLLGVDIPKIGRDRVSLAPWLQSQPIDPADDVTRRRWALSAATQHGPFQRGLRHEQMKLITYDDHIRDVELYDLDVDPTEQSDASATHGDLLAHLRRLLRHRWTELGEVRDNEDLEVDDETRETLKALGYVD